MRDPLRPTALRHLIRLDNAKLAGWQLRLPPWHPQGPSTRYFADSLHGSADKALAAARRARNVAFKEAGLPLIPKGLHPLGEVGASNSSGLTGVCMTVYYARKSAAWVALWTENKKAKRKAFYIGGHTYEEAFRLAVELRQAKTGIRFPEKAVKAALANPLTRRRMLDCVGRKMHLA